MTNLAVASRSLALPSLAMLISCGGATSLASVDNSTASATPVAESDFAASYAQAMCDLLNKCCITDFNVSAGCGPQGAPTGTYVYRKYDPAQGGACIAAIRSFAPTCLATQSKVAPCLALYVGTLAIGAPCQASEDCSGYSTGDAYCYSDFPFSSASCQPTAKAGEPCLGNYVSRVSGARKCGAGLYCGESTQCTPLAGLGQACDPAYLSSSCEPSLRCDRASPKCTSKATAGASCTVNSDCIDGKCTNGACQGPIVIATSSLCSTAGGNLVANITADSGTVTDAGT